MTRLCQAGVLVPLALFAMAATVAPSSPCAIVVPTEIAAGQARWLGDCTSGHAAGVGVLRVTNRGHLAFFFGRVHAGRPITGLVIRASGDYVQIRGMDQTGRTLLADDEHIPEQDRAWADAAAGARLVARRFSTAGNAGSSSFYMRWAQKIETQRPE